MIGQGSSDLWFGECHLPPTCQNFVSYKKSILHAWIKLSCGTPLSSEVRQFLENRHPSSCRIQGVYIFHFSTPVVKCYFWQTILSGTEGLPRKVWNKNCVSYIGHWNRLGSSSIRQSLNFAVLGQYFSVAAADNAALLQRCEAFNKAEIIFLTLSVPLGFQKYATCNFPSNFIFH